MAQAKSDFDVFISYRREANAEAARLICYALASKGLKVFLDVDSLKSGHFDERLLDTIRSTPNFVVILSPGSMIRCRSLDDWVRKEILEAIARERNIVPVLMGAFSFEEEALPGELESLRRHNGIRYHHEYFAAMIDRLVDCLKLPEGLSVSAGGAPVTEVTRKSARARSPDYVFLDFDGVLRPTGSAPYGFDRRCLQRFERLMREYPSAKIVITSSWRLGMNLRELRSRFSAEIAERIVGVTPVFEGDDGPDRHQEILAYLKKQGQRNALWVAIDDDRDRYGEGISNVVVTRADRGFDDAAADEFRSLLA